MARIKNSKLTAVRVPVRLPNGRPSTGLRFKNLVAAEKNISGIPSAGPRSAPVFSAANPEPYSMPEWLIEKLRANPAAVALLRSRPPEPTPPEPTPPDKARPKPKMPATGNYDADGYDKTGRSSYGYDRAGFFGNGWHLDGYNLDGRRFDVNGFNGSHIHRETGTHTAPDGRRFIDFLPIRDVHGFGHDGFNVSGMNARGFGRNGLHESTGTVYDPAGFDDEYCDAGGFDERGYNVDFYSEPRRSVEYEIGWHRDTKADYSPDGFDMSGLDKHGFDSTGMFWERD